MKLAQADEHHSLVVDTTKLTRWWFKLTGVVPKTLTDEKINGATAVAPGVIFGTYTVDTIPRGTLIHEMIHHKQMIELGLLGFFAGLLLISGLAFIPSIQTTVLAAASPLPALAYFILIPLLCAIVAMPIAYVISWIINMIKYKGDATQAYEDNVFEEEAYAGTAIPNYLNRRPMFAWARLGSLDSL